MNILFACGGTAGHINPALAVAGAIRRDHPDAGILFAGNPSGMEAELVRKAGYDFAPIRIQGFQRRLNLKNIGRNLSAAACLLTSGPVAKKIIAGFGPDVVVGTGGYVSGPVLRKAAKLGYKTLTHEQNAFPGVTTKLLAGYVDRVLLAVEEARAYLPAGRKYVVTGNPVRQELLRADRERARQKLGAGQRLCILSFGGSLGAARVNDAMAEIVAHFYDRGLFHHIHAVGRHDGGDFERRLSERGIAPAGDPHLDIREYIDDMADALAAADLVICRAGALTLSELQAVGRASILIPSPNVAENHQYHNAMAMARKNAAQVLEEKDLSGQRLCRMIEELAADPQELANLGKNAAAMAITNAHRRICDEIYRLIP